MQQRDSNNAILDKVLLEKELKFEFATFSLWNLEDENYSGDFEKSDFSENYLQLNYLQSVW